MKSAPQKFIRNTLRLGVLAATLLAAGHVHAVAAQWTLTEIAPLPGGLLVLPTSLNDAGQVVGASTVNVTFRPFVWQNGTTTDLGTLPGSVPDFGLAFAINNSGQIAGVSGSRAVLWQNGTPIDLGAPPGSTSASVGINDAGQIVGDLGEQAFVWQNGTMTQLADLSGGTGSSSALDINNNGQIVGWSDSLTGSPAVLWQNDGSIVNLGDLPGGIDDGSANAINNLGQIVGSSEAATGLRAFLWQNGVMTDLGDLAGGLDESDAFDINDLGQIVGTSESAAGTRAVLWENGSLTDLNELAGIAESGYTLEQALAINNLGQILAAGTDGNGGFRSFLLTPAPVPEADTWAMLLAGLGLVGWAARRRASQSVTPSL